MKLGSHPQAHIRCHRDESPPGDNSTPSSASVRLNTQLLTSDSPSELPPRLLFSFLYSSYNPFLSSLAPLRHPIFLPTVPLLLSVSSLPRCYPHSAFYISSFLKCRSHLSSHVLIPSSYHSCGCTCCAVVSWWLRSCSTAAVCGARLLLSAATAGSSGYRSRSRTPHRPGALKGKQQNQLLSS